MEKRREREENNLKQIDKQAADKDIDEPSIRSYRHIRPKSHCLAVALKSRHSLRVVALKSRLILVVALKSRLILEHCLPVVVLKSGRSRNWIE